MDVRVVMVTKGESFSDDLEDNVVAEEDGFIVSIGDRSAFVGKSVLLKASHAGIEEVSMDRASREGPSCREIECEVRRIIKERISGGIPPSVETQVEAICDIWVLVGREEAMGAIEDVIRGDLLRGKCYLADESIS